MPTKVLTRTDKETGASYDVSIDEQIEEKKARTELAKALATFTTYASYPALDCLSQNFVQCGQAIKRVER